MVQAYLWFDSLGLSDLRKKDGFQGSFAMDSGPVGDSGGSMTPHRSGALAFLVPAAALGALDSHVQVVAPSFNAEDICRPISMWAKCGALGY